ncbi:MAG: hypothetical protein ABIU05_02400, partial [Nitrospirales bacterium]
AFECSSQPPSSRCCNDYLNPPWLPLSEWCRSPALGMRWWIAIVSACCVRSPVSRASNAQPITVRE